MKYDALILVALIVAIIPFLCYAMLRQFLVPASRYWFYASSPVLVLLGLGIHYLLSEIRKPGLARILGYGIGGLMLTTNVITVLSIISLDGRTAPYRKMQAYIEALPKDRTVISMNYYDNRFLGGYYPIPNDGSRLSPAAYEEGADVRVKGTRKILQLVPDALVYVGSDEWQQERQRAGSVTDSGYVYQAPKILELSHMLRLYPEPTGKPYPIALYHETRESLALRADASGVPLSVPGSGFKTINFRNPQGEVFFGLSSASQIQFNIYIPQKMQAQSCELQLVSVSYRSSGLQGGLDGLSLPVLAQQLSITEAQGYFIPQKKQFKGLPSPDYLVQDGMNFVLAMNPQAINIPLGALAPGWHTVTLTTTQKSPWIILSHACVASIVRP